MRGVDSVFSTGAYAGQPARASDLFGNDDDDDSDESDARDQLRAALEAGQRAGGSEDRVKDSDEDEDSGETDGSQSHDSDAEPEDVVAQLEREEQEGLRMLSKSARSEVSRARAALEQVSTFDKLLELRIRFQPLLQAANKLPRPRFAHVLTSKGKGMRQAASQARDKTAELVGSLLQLSRSRACQWPGVAASLRTLDREIGLGHGTSSTSAVGAPGLCLDAHVMTARATQARRAGKRARPIAEHEDDSPAARLDGLWLALSQQWAALLPTAEGLLDEASASAGLTSRAGGRSGALVTLGKPPSQQAKEAAADEAVMRRRAHPRLGEATPIGHKLTAPKSSASGGGAVELDEEAYDDTALYHALLKDLTSSAEAAGHGAAVHESSGRGHKAGMRRVVRQVDRKASKGRRIRYTAFEELVSFVVPVPRVNAPVEADTVLASLFQSDA